MITPSENVTAEGQAWAAQLAAWALPDAIIAQAPESPWVHDVASFAVDDALDRDTRSAVAAREVLPLVGGVVLDVGCGGGRSSMPLVPPAASLIGTDQSEAMLSAFAAAAASSGVAVSTVLGRWPDVAPQTSVADVVVCHHVLFNVSDVEAFVLALTDHARLAVVVEVPRHHPLSAWSGAWKHFWDLDRPLGPTDDDLVAVLRALGLEPEVWHGPRSSLSRSASDPARMIESSRRRLCLPASRDVELAAYLAEHPPAWEETVATIRWPGSARPGMSD